MLTCQILLEVGSYAHLIFEEKLATTNAELDGIGLTNGEMVQLSTRTTWEVLPKYDTLTIVIHNR